MKRLFFDIETLANPENCALMPEPVIEAPSNYKDPVKIAEYVAEKTTTAKAAALDKAALDPDYGRVLSIGWSYGKDIHTLVVGQEIHSNINPDEVGHVDETDVIETFWYHFCECGGNVVGFNVLNFDLPYLMRRSMALGVKVPMIPNLARYRTEPVTDLMQILYGWGADKYKGLKQIARLYRIPNDCEGVDGSQVKDLTTEQLTAYQISDVRLVIELYQRMNGVYFNHRE